MRAIDAVHALCAKVGYGRGDNPTLPLLRSHVGGRTTGAAAMAAMRVLALVAGVQSVMQLGGITIDHARWPVAARTTATRTRPANPCCRASTVCSRTATT
jgi:hypothetical protein